MARLLYSLETEFIDGYAIRDIGGNEFIAAIVTPDGQFVYLHIDEQLPCGKWITVYMRLDDYKEIDRWDIEYVMFRNGVELRGLDSVAKAIARAKSLSSLVQHVFIYERR